MIRVLKIGHLPLLICVLLLTTPRFVAAYRPVENNLVQGPELVKGSDGSTNFIQAGQVRQAIGVDKSMVLVDVRLPDSYQQYRIPGSINIPLSLIRTKKFLANKFVVLVNNGFRHKLLDSEIARLNSSGFKKTAILAGGITGWIRTGGKIEGDFSSARRANMVSASDFYSEQGRNGLVTVNVSGKNLSGWEINADVLNIPFDHDLMAIFRQEVITAAVPHSKGGLPDVLILADNPEMYGEIENLLKDIGVNVFFLEGGLPAYRDFIQKREKLRNPKAVVSEGESCPVCPK